MSIVLLLCKRSLARHRTEYQDTSIFIGNWRETFLKHRQENKVSWPISRVLSWTTIPLGCLSPNTSSNLPDLNAGRAKEVLFGLAPSGVCRAGLLPDSRCALTAPFHPYRHLAMLRRYLSVALSVDSRRPGVTWHSALWSPDFPL